MAIFRIQFKPFIIVIGLSIVIAIVSLLAFISKRNDENEMPDPQFELATSSMPMGLYNKAGVVSNGGPCAQIGVDVMAKGGNAVDAAIATMICDGASCPQFMGLGGGFVMTIYNATTKKVMSINAREMAPKAATESMFVKEPTLSVYGGLAVAVPGEVKGYMTVYNRFGGNVSWASLFEPTIKLCEEGMLISERFAISLKNNEELIKNDTILRKTFFDEKTGHVKTIGEMYTLPKLAETMKVIAKEGGDALYNGTLSDKLLDDLKKVNGIMTREDLVAYAVKVEKSFSVKLKSGHTIHTGPPPGSGVILAYILRVLDGLLPAPNEGLDAHRIVEAFKFGYGERTQLGDAMFVNVSAIYDKVKSDSYMDKIRSQILDNFTSEDPKYYGANFSIPENHGTGNLAVIDSMGNVVISTCTINTYFGSGFTSPSTGIILNNEMDDFSTPGGVNSYGFPSSPANYIEPYKQPMSSMCPSIFTDKNGDFAFAVGAAGGSKITLATAYVSAYKLWYNKTLKEAIDKPRIFHQLVPMQIQYEYGITKDVIQTLKDIGHPVTRLPNNRFSASTAIAKTISGMIEVMPDYRRPGNCSGY
ncbi:hypothetical protein AGLY_001186 [Aphis glycines]|uniref:Gamma-glutamyltransferase n=1 Tax=Aphis glycines TaxID=307491 RepID=A0A6G0U9L2_APHGL|nr:hypothetical protein AGLY_001186 [Aphis glycines]